MRFGTDTSGYSTPGTIETTQGGIGTALSGTPIRVSEFADAPCAEAAVETDTLLLSSSEHSLGYVNWFAGTAYGTLKLKPSFTTTSRTSCGGGVSTGAPLPAPPTVTLAYQGSFHFSPSVTLDGRIRLGVMKVVDAPAPDEQRSIFGLLSACLNDGACPTTEPTGVAQFPQRLKVKSLTAQLLLGLPGA
jgi:hypothetical protein